MHCGARGHGSCAQFVLVASIAATAPGLPGIHAASDDAAPPPRDTEATEEAAEFGTRSSQNPFAGRDRICAAHRATARFGCLLRRVRV